MIFVPIWSLLVYVPVAHWVWNPQGWLAQMGAPDYAGGLVVEIVSGGVRPGIGTGPRPADGFRPSRCVRTPAVRPARRRSALSGWFDLNAGPALAADVWPRRSSSTHSSPAVRDCLGWLSSSRNRDGHPTTFGAASGVVAGLVAITPSCGTVNMFGALVIGLIAARLLVRAGMEAQSSATTTPRRRRRAPRRRNRRLLLIGLSRRP
ncbi:unnamed protein product, partial [Mesorhabditis spiculigera]